MAIGVKNVEGEFDHGDVVSLTDLSGREFARGLINYDAAEMRRVKGLKTSDIAAALGYRPYDEVIHRDNMVITSRKDN